MTSGDSASKLRINNAQDTDKDIFANGKGALTCRTQHNADGGKLSRPRANDTVLGRHAVFSRPHKGVDLNYVAPFKGSVCSGSNIQRKS